MNTIGSLIFLLFITQLSYIFSLFVSYKWPGSNMIKKYDIVYFISSAVLSIVAYCIHRGFHTTHDVMWSLATMLIYLINVIRQKIFENILLPKLIDIDDIIKE